MIAIVTMTVVVLVVTWWCWPSRYPIGFSFVVMALLTTVFAWMVGIMANLLVVDDLLSVSELQLLRQLRVFETLLIGGGISVFICSIWAYRKAGGAG